MNVQQLRTAAWLSEAYCDPLQADQRFRDLDATINRVRFGLRALLQVTPYVLITLWLSRVIVFRLMGLPELEPTQTWDFSELMLAYAITVASAVLWSVVKFRNLPRSASATVVGGVTFGVAGCIAHAVAGGVRGLEVIAAIIVMCGGAALGRSFYLHFRNTIAAVLLLVAASAAIALSVTVVSRSLGSQSIALVGGDLGAATLGVAFGSALGFSVSAAHGRHMAMVQRLAFTGLFTITAIIAGNIFWSTKHGLIFGVSLGVACAFCIFRAYYLFLHLVFLWPSSRGQRYVWHPIAWDSMCGTPFPGLDLLLAAYFEVDENLAENEFARLATYAVHKEQATRALIRVSARQISECSDVRGLILIESKLPTDHPDLLRVRALVSDIATRESQVVNALTLAERREAAQSLSHRLASYNQTPFPTYVHGLIDKALSHWRSVAHQQLERLNQAEFKAQRTAGWQELARRASHDIATPLSAIAINLGTLERRATGNSELREIIEEMQSSVGTATNVLEQFKTLTRPLELYRRETNLLPLLEEAATLARETGVHVEILSDGNTNAFLDSDRLKDCVRELFENALRWFDKSDKRVMIEIANPSPESTPQRLNTSRRYVRLRFQDNGPGIPEANKETIFEPFVTTHRKGTGMGLAMVRRIVEAHDGDIREVGQQGRGAIFEVFLPRFNY